MRGLDADHSKQLHQQSRRGRVQRGVSATKSVNLGKRLCHQTKKVKPEFKDSRPFEILLGNLQPGGLVVPPLVVVVHGGQAGVAEGSAGIECCSYCYSKFLIF